ncbi:unnamed protein product, partial [Didymodactylos carnosus]
MFLTPVPVPT